MNIGAVFPHLEIGNDPVVLRDWAQAAEALGYSHLLAYDHVLGAVHEDRKPKLTGPYTEESAFHEPFVLFGYFAACTERVELVTGVIILPQRQTALVAKQAAEVDILSGGRLRLGVGTGWNFVEYESLGKNFADRGRRQEEQIVVLRELWANPVIDYTGVDHRIERAGLKPLPGRQIPIWLGGFSEVAFRRAARMADGFIFAGGSANGLASLDRIRSYLDEAGRDADAFGAECMLNYTDGPGRWAEDIEAWRAAGADYVSMRAMGAGLSGPQAHIDALREYWEAVH
ncbi:MAG: LLM class F420-dependent oxidoreductase [Gammaproteobacteria bacterium]|nr:LLM class F420-dependent oxidoreductase [Gammaproteobacteria bacterium]